MSSFSDPYSPNLIADDQPDVLVALRLLLKSAGYQTEAANCPKAVLDAIKKRQFDVVLIDLNYARDTTSGQEGLDLISRIQAEDKLTPDRGDDRVGHSRSGGRSDASWRPRFCAKALGELASVTGSARPGRAGPHAPAAATTGIATPGTATHLSERTTRGAADTKAFDGHQSPGPRWFGFVFVVARSGTIGGDYLAAFPVSKDKAAVCIADVSGKGLPAALMMSNMQAALKSAASADVMPVDLCSQLNRILFSNIPANKFITCFYGLLDVQPPGSAVHQRRPQSADAGTGQRRSAPAGGRRPGTGRFCRFYLFAW